MDWNAIKTEYVTTDTSYRKLAGKYGISATQIGNVARDEGWVQARERFLEETYAKTLKEIANKQAYRVKRLQTITDKILDKIESAVDIMSEADLKAFRQVTEVLKDIKDIQMLKSDADMREQEARIDKMKKESSDEKKETTIIVQIDDDLKKWGN